MNARNLALLACLALFAGSLVAITFTWHRPLGANITARTDHQCEGTEEFTCGPDSLVSAYSWIGHVVTEREMVNACGTTRYGTTAEAVAKAAHGQIVPFPLSAPGRTFVVCIDRADAKNHMVCAHGELNGWTVNDPAHQDPEHWLGSDFEGATKAIEVMP